MSITKLPPNTIHLGGHMTLVNEYVADEALTPGWLIELVNDSGTPKWGAHDDVDAACAKAFALNQDEMNLGVDTQYADGDLVKAGIMSPGATVWALVPSGQSLVPGALLQSNGDGRLKALGSGVAIALSLETVTATADTRVRVEVL